MCNDFVCCDKSKCIYEPYCNVCKCPKCTIKGCNMCVSGHACKSTTNSLNSDFATSSRKNGGNSSQESAL